MRLNLRDGTDVDRAIEFLVDRAHAAQRLGGEVSWSQSYVERRRDAYLDWVETTQSLFSNHTEDLDVIAMLHTAAYWEIRQLGVGSPRPVPLIESETRRQVRNLEWLRDDLSKRRDRALAAPGHIAIVDTNVLLHYQLPDSVDWPAVVGEDDVRLVVPLRVIEEIDAGKYSQNEKSRQRARALLPKLRGFVGPGGTPGLVRDRTTIEVFIHAGPRVRPGDADTEILDTADELRRLSGRATSIVTGDIGMTLRAEAQGVRTVSMPDQYRRE